MEKCMMELLGEREVSIIILMRDGLVFYKRKFRTIEGYLQQGGNLTKLVFGKIKKPQAISKRLLEC